MKVLSIELALPPSSADGATFKIPHGASPSSPVNGDIWTTTSGILARINGTTRTLAHTATWSAMSVAEGVAGTATTSRLMRADYLKQIIEQVGGSPIAKGDIVIPTTGWVANTGDYAYKLDFAIAGVLASDDVNVNILPDDLDIAQAAEIASYVEEYTGGITFYSKSIPSAAINAKYVRAR